MVNYDVEMRLFLWGEGGGGGGGIINGDGWFQVGWSILLGEGMFIVDTYLN